MIYVYESHLGGLFVTTEELESTHCDSCGDSDWLLGIAAGKYAAIAIVRQQKDYTKEHIKEVIIEIKEIKD